MGVTSGRVRVPVTRRTSPFQTSLSSITAITSVMIAPRITQLVNVHSTK